MINTNQIHKELSNSNIKITRLCHKLLDDNFLNANGRIKEELKFKINNPTQKIQNSKFIGKPEDTFETMLFLPPGEGRQGEGGLRTKGYFKHSYKLVDGKWFIADSDNNPVIPAPEDIQNSINQYLKQKNTQNQSPKTYSPEPRTQNPEPDSLPLISIITVVYNGAKYLEETIQSVINQSYPNVEYIIIDGGSTDGTPDIIKKYENYIDYWVSEKDKGIYDAMNKGIKVAMGDWISFLGADDILLKDAMQSYIGNINDTQSSIEYVSARIDLIDNKKKVIRTIGKAWSWNKFRHYMNVAHVASLHHRKLFSRFGNFDVSYKIAGDYEFLLRAKNNLNTLFLNNKVAFMRCDGSSNKKINVVIYETKLAKLKYSDQSKFLIHVDYLLALIKVYIRKILWY